MWSLAVPHSLEPVNLFGAHLSQEGNCLSRLEGRARSHLLKTPGSIWQGGWGKETEQRRGGWELSHSFPPSCIWCPRSCSEQCLSNALAWTCTCSSLREWEKTGWKLLKCLENIQGEACQKCNILMKTAWAWLNSDSRNKTNRWELTTIDLKKKESSPCIHRAWCFMRVFTEFTAPWSSSA